MWKEKWKTHICCQRSSFQKDIPSRLNVITGKINSMSTWDLHLNVGDQQDLSVFFVFLSGLWLKYQFFFGEKVKFIWGIVSRNLCRCYINFFQLKQWRWRERDDSAIVLMELGHPRILECPRFRRIVRHLVFFNCWHTRSVYEVLCWPSTSLE